MGKAKQIQKYLPYVPLWELEIEELTGHNIEMQGRQDVNKLLKAGWIFATYLRFVIKKTGYGGSGQWQS